MNVTVTNEDGTTSEYAADEDFEVESTTVDEQPSCSSQLQYMKQIAHFLLKIKEIRRVSQTALHGLVDDFTSIFQYTVDKIKDDISLCLKANR